MIRRLELNGKVCQVQGKEVRGQVYVYNHTWNSVEWLDGGVEVDTVRVRITV